MYIYIYIYIYIYMCVYMKAELWLSPFLRFSNSIFLRNSSDIPVKFR